MHNFEKLAAYLDSFKEEDPNYAAASLIKAKIAADLQDTRTINNGDEENLQDNDITMATPEQQAEGNTEGEIMAGAFQELDAMNQIDDEKKEIAMPNKAEQTTQSDDVLDVMGTTSKQASAFIKDVLLKELPDKTQEDVLRFIPDGKPTTRLIHYGSVVKELLPKVDKLNFDVAEKHIKDGKVDKDELMKAMPTKYLLLMNDNLVDGHHFLAKCKAADITCSLNVLDLTPARFQKKQASLFEVLQARLR